MRGDRRTFMTSSLSSSHLTKTDEEEERGREVDRDDTSCTSRRARAARLTDPRLDSRRLS